MENKALKPSLNDGADPERSSRSDDATVPTTSEHSVTKKQEERGSNEAGPSGVITLPGSLPEVIKYTKSKTPGLSKSEQNIRHVVTAKEVANALNAINLTSNINKELRIPIPESDQPIDNVDPAAFVELRKFMESCFKINNETSANILNEVVAHSGLNPVQNVPTPIVMPNIIQELPNSSCPVDNVLGTPNVMELTKIIPSPIVENATLVENSVPIPNNVLSNTIEPKLSKTEKKKVTKKSSGNSSDPKVDFPIATRDSMSSIGSNVCRICMTRGKERLISPCNCKGSLANVHLSCLERWLNQVGRNHCELCGFSYPAIRTPRYTVLQALRLWFGNPRNRSHLQSDCLIFWLLSTVTAGLLAVCIVGTQYFVIEGNKFGKHDAGVRKGEGISHRITETAMDFFMAIVLCGYSVTVYLLWKDHYVMWNRWRRANVNVRLLLSPDTNPVPFVPNPRYNIV